MIGSSCRLIGGDVNIHSTYRSIHNLNGGYSGYAPEPDVENAAEEFLVGGDEFAAVEDEFLLQHGVEHAERLHLGVDGRVQHGRRLRLVEHGLVPGYRAHGHLAQREQYRKCD